MSFLIKRPVQCAAAAAAALALALAVSAASSRSECCSRDDQELTGNETPDTASGPLPEPTASELDELGGDSLLDSEDTGPDIRSASVSTAATISEAPGAPPQSSSFSSAATSTAVSYFAPSDKATVDDRTLEAAISSMFCSNLTELQQAAQSYSASKTGHAAQRTSTTTVDGGEFTVTLTESTAGSTSGASGSRQLQVALQLAAAWAIAVPP